ncbi:MAG: adenosylcobinamide-GDP ribazoletransferase [Coriobacteriia bacterium]|nr:adenosylcobinamide-GDP ribazoletransferase [Coriobacteriia bacterium]
MAFARDMALAVTLLTAAPVPCEVPEPGARTGAAAHFPAVGLVIGLLGFAFCALSVSLFGGVSDACAAIVLVGAAVLTRAMHWDALADCADAWFAQPARRREVMKDPRIGAFGAVAIVFVALTQWGALKGLGTSMPTLACVVLAAVCGRLAATFSAWFGKAARPDGLGASVMGPPRIGGIIFAALPVLAASALAIVCGMRPLSVLALTGLGLVLAFGVQRVIALRFGGVSGDTMGASVLIVETSVMLAVQLVAALFRIEGFTL